MSKSELKAAMESLQVKKPFNLKGAGPSFVQPEQTSAWAPGETLVARGTQVMNSAPAEKQTGGPNPTQVENETPVSFQAPAQNSTPVDLRPGANNPTQVESRPPVPKTTPAENPTGVANSAQVHTHSDDSASSSRSHLEQDSSVAFESRASDGLERGYTRIPNEILIKLVSGDFTRNEIKLALLIARFTISFQRKLAPLSKSVLARRAGIRESAVLDAISGLVSKGLVEKQQGDQHRPNLLGLILPDDWDQPTRPQGPKPAPAEKPTPVHFSGPTQVGNSTLAGAGKPPYFKDNSRYLNTLSQLPEPLHKYFRELKPQKKRESEWKFFEELKVDYPITDISDCLEHLQARGILRRGPKGDETQPCHSPMAYLSKAISEVLTIVRAERQKALDRDERERRRVEAEHAHRESEKLIHTEWEEKENAFLSAFPALSAQNEELRTRLRGLPFSPESRTGRHLAIARWWDEHAA